MIPSVLGARDNIWSITMIAKADGMVVVLPVNVPGELHRKLLAFLRTELLREPSGSVRPS